MTIQKKKNNDEWLIKHEDFDRLEGREIYVPYYPDTPFVIAGIFTDGSLMLETREKYEKQGQLLHRPVKRNGEE